MKKSEALIGWDETKSFSCPECGHPVPDGMSVFGFCSIVCSAIDDQRKNLWNAIAIIQADRKQWGK